MAWPGGKRDDDRHPTQLADPVDALQEAQSRKGGSVTGPDDGVVNRRSQIAGRQVQPRCVRMTRRLRRLAAGDNFGSMAFATEPIIGASDWAATRS